MRTIIGSLSSKNPTEYILNYDVDENASGITVIQLRNALFKVIKGKDKTVHIARGSSKEFLSTYHKQYWRFDAKQGVISPPQGLTERIT